MTGGAQSARQRVGRLALHVVYWLAVLAVSIAILIGLILFLESRDNSQVGRGATTTSTTTIPQLRK